MTDPKPRRISLRFNDEDYDYLDGARYYARTTFQDVGHELLMGWARAVIDAKSKTTDAPGAGAPATPTGSDLSNKKVETDHRNEKYLGSTGSAQYHVLLELIFVLGYAPSIEAAKHALRALAELANTKEHSVEAVSLSEELARKHPDFAGAYAALISNESSGRSSGSKTLKGPRGGSDRRAG